MLLSIQLENFKAFGQRTIIPLAPITLIFGQNSAGKSSILQALNLLKQTRESRDTAALLLPKTEKGFVDLGSFQEMIFDHDLSRTLAIRLEMGLFDCITPSISVELQFLRRTLQDEICLKSMLLFLGETKIAKFEATGTPETIVQSPSFTVRYGSREGNDKRRAMRCVEVTDSMAYWDKILDHVFTNRERIRRNYQEKRKKLESREKLFLFPSPTVFNFIPFVGGIAGAVQDALQDALQDTIRRRQLADLDRTIRLLDEVQTKNQLFKWYRDEQLKEVIYLDGFLPMMAVDQEKEKHDLSLGELSLPSGLPELAMLGGEILKIHLSSLFPLGSFRKPPSRLYTFTGTIPQDVGYEGHALPDLLFRKPELVARTNEWLRGHEIDYEISIRSLGKEMADLFEVRLRDTRREKEVLVGLSDVGFGISQILPLVVQSIAGQNQIITIEQPEVHIHPRLQADLGDLLIEAIQEPSRNQFIIETHSEHLALRLQRRVREKKLSPKDISVIYVSRGPNGSTVQPLRLDEEGDFMDDFPGGFFPERLEELR